MRKSSKICVVKHCRRKKKRAGKSVNGKQYYNSRCAMHIQQEYVKNNPERAVYHHLAKSARKRKKPILFTLTFEWFEKWIKTTNYMRDRGPYAGDATIDRIIPALGYADGNLQVITRAHNSAKTKFDRDYYVNGGNYSPEYYFYEDEIDNTVNAVEHVVEPPPF